MKSAELFPEAPDPETGAHPQLPVKLALSPSRQKSGAIQGCPTASRVIPVCHNSHASIADSTQ